MKTINIKGKEYVPVVERVKEFHKIYPNGWIETKIHENSTPERVIVLAKVWIDDKRFFCGASQAEWGKGMMGSVALEVAETSCIGRALGFANIGLLDGIATADEIRKVGKSKPSKEEEIPIFDEKTGKITNLDDDFID